MAQNMCRAQTKSGKSCGAKAAKGDYCSLHSEPERAAKLGRMSGESRRSPEEQIVLAPPQTAADLHKALSQVFSEVGAGNVGTKLGTSLAYIASVLIKSLEMSDHEIRLRAIEELMRVRSIRSGGLEE